MKKLIFLFISLFAAGALFQACDNSKTYAEMLEDEKDAIDRFIKDKGIKVISKSEFDKDTITDLSSNEYVSLSDGVYMQVVYRGNTQSVDTFANNNEICVRYVEEDIMNRDTTCFNIFIDEWGNLSDLYERPSVFRYVLNNGYGYGTFVSMDYYWASYYQTTAVPAGWLLPLPYLSNNAHVRLIVPSKSGHSSSSESVTPFYYDIWSFSKAKS